MSNYIWVVCPSCGKGRQKRKSHTLLPSNTNLCTVCWGRRLNGDELKGFFMQRGYKLVKLQRDDFFYPMANSRGWVREHRLVVAKAFGRCLKRNEVVHHKKGFAKDDNRYPETLQLNTIDGHNTITAMQNHIDALERELALYKRNNK